MPPEPDPQAADPGDHDVYERLADLTHKINTGEDAKTERAQIIRDLRNAMPDYYTQKRLADLAGITQQAVSSILDKKRVTWWLDRPGTHHVEITGPTIEEAVLAHRKTIANSFGRGLVDWDGGNIVDVTAELDPRVVSLYNITVDVEVKGRRGGSNQVFHIAACAGDRQSALRRESNQRSEALARAAQATKD